MSSKDGSYDLIPLEKGLWHVKYDGPVTIQTRNLALDEFLATVGDDSLFGILVDLRAADLQLSLLDAFAWGDRLAAEIQLHGCKVVFLETPEHTERSQFVETVARNRGGTTRVMTDWDAAIAWLKEGSR